MAARRLGRVAGMEERALPLRFPIAIGLGVLIALACASASPAGQPGVPAWLAAHVGEGDGQIAPVVLARARALYQRKGVRNPCYFALGRDPSP